MSEYITPPEVQTEIGAVVVRDNVFNESKFNHAVMLAMPLKTQMDFVGRVIQSVDIFYVRPTIQILGQDGKGRRVMP